MASLSAFSGRKEGHGKGVGGQDSQRAAIRSQDGEETLGGNVAFPVTPMGSTQACQARLISSPVEEPNERE